MDQLCTLADLVRGSWEYAQPVYMCLMDLEKPYDWVSQGVMKVTVGVWFIRAIV